MLAKTSRDTGDASPYMVQDMQGHNICILVLKRSSWPEDLLCTNFGRPMINGLTYGSANDLLVSCMWQA